MSWTSVPGSGNLVMSSGDALSAGTLLVWSTPNAVASGTYLTQGALFVQSGHLFYRSPAGRLTTVASN